MNQPTLKTDSSGLVSAACCKARADVENATQKLEKRKTDQEAGSPSQAAGHAKAYAEAQNAINDALERYRRHCPQPPPERAVELGEGPVPQPKKDQNHRL